VLTRCPTCQTTFHVTVEQLKARQGRVRCGHCLGVFNALEALVVDAPVAPVPVEPPTAKAIELTPAPAPVVPPPEPPKPAPVAFIPEPAVAPVSPQPVAIAPAVAAPVIPAPPPAVAEGEEVAEPDIEYVEIGELEAIEDEAAEDVAAAEDDAVTEVLVTPDQVLDDALAGGGISIEGFQAPTVEGEVAEAESAPPQDPYTKTVVGFTWYVEPESPGEQPATDDFAKTVVQSVRMAEPTAPPAPVEPAAEDEFTRTVIAPWRGGVPEPPPAPAAVEPPKPSIQRAFERSAVPPAASVEDFAKTVVQSIRMFEPETAEDQAFPPQQPPAAVERPAEEFDETATQPQAVDQDEIETLTGEEPLHRISFPPIEPVETSATRTFVERIDLAEPESEPEPEPAAPPPRQAQPARPPADDDFAKTVVQSIRMFEPEPEFEDEAPVEDFDAITVDAPHAMAIEPAPPPGDRVPMSTPAFALDDHADHEVSETDSTDLKRAIANEFARTVVDSSMVARLGQHASGGLDFELEPIDDIHVEEEAEAPSITELSIRPATAFPTLKGLADEDVPPSHETANAILDQVAISAPATAAEQPAAAATALPLEQLERAAVPVALAAAPGEPIAESEGEVEAVAVAEPIPELQELPRRRRWPWVLGSLIALPVLAIQAIVHFRVELSVLAPRAKPALIAMCEVFDCKLPLPSQIDLIGIETSDLSPGPEGAGHLQLSATLRNRAPFGQAWPDLELTLTDAADKALVRRTLSAAEYLPPGHKPDAPFPARSEQAVHLDLQAPGVPAVGYRLYVFYP